VSVRFAEGKKIAMEGEEEEDADPTLDAAVKSIL
jgi:hypothetical protein